MYKVYYLYICGMKKEKQLDVIKCIDSGKYKIEDGNILSKKSDGWHVLKVHTQKSGYKQFDIFNGKRGTDGIKVRVYVHVFIFIYCNGIYEEGLLIDHIDGNVGNNRIDNLRTVSKADNINGDKFAKTRRDTNQFKPVNPIRGYEIAEIRRLMALGHTQQGIAKNLGLNRLSVRYTYNNIKAGKTLKYENWFND